MLASILKRKLNDISTKWKENIFELNKEKLMSNLEHEKIELNCLEYTKNQIVNFAEPIEDFSKTKSLSNFVY